ncbi:hypothetical protein KCP73_17885 [Salmonella enterica subsp. enterica]|nr:hypothetical protein KCP73_17885 [Salmonella enterica subsp. enterica]
MVLRRQRDAGRACHRWRSLRRQPTLCSRCNSKRKVTPGAAAATAEGSGDVPACIYRWYGDCNLNGAETAFPIGERNAGVAHH